MGRQRYGAEGWRWDKFKRLVFATYGDSCIVCYHGGATCVDHVIPLTEAPERVFDLSNARPVHCNRNRCPVCGLACNNIKSGMSLERARRIAAGRAPGAKPPRSRNPEIPPRAERPGGEPGRDW